MGLMDGAYRLLGNLLLERPARDKTLADFRDEMENGGREAQQRLAAAGATPENRQTLRHIIGIERWGQQRLQAALGEPLVMDESDGYYPAVDADWDQLRETFSATRHETLTVIQKLEEAEVGRSLTVPHNQWGDLSAYGWLNYLNGHANGDMKKIK